MNCNTSVVLPVLSVAASFGLASIAQAQQYDVILESGLNPEFRSFGGVVINDNGQIALSTRDLTGAGSRTQLLLIQPDGTIERLVSEGDVAPDGNGTLFSTFSRFDSGLALNNNGQVALVTRYETSPENRDRAIILADATGVQLIARTGQAAGDGLEFQIGEEINGSIGSTVNVDDPVLNDLGQIAFRDRLTSSSLPFQPRAVFAAEGVGLRQVLIETSSSPVPSISGGVGEPQINNLGEIFVKFEERTQPFLPPLPSLLVDNGGSQSIVYGPGTPLPDGSTAVSFFSFDAAQEGGIGLRGFTTTDDPASRLAVTYGTSAGLDILSRTGEPLAAGGELLSNVLSGRLEANNVGGVAFVGAIGGVPDSPPGTTDFNGLFVADDNGLTEIARHGTVLPDGNVIESFNRVTINDLGQVAFEVRFDVAGGPSSFELGLYFFDPQSGTFPVVSTVSDLFGSEVFGYNFSGGTSQGGGLNNNGELVFRYLLEDSREGVAVFTIPEPSLALVIGPMLLLARRRR